MEIGEGGGLLRWGERTGLLRWYKKEKTYKFIYINLLAELEMGEEDEAVLSFPLSLSL
jgi:hypothetical protein